MNKAELIDSLEGRLGSKKAANDALEAVLDVIIREVARGNKVGITGFGTFEKVARAARTGRNPRTGDSVRIKKTSVPKFKPGTAFKEVTADPRKLPKTGNAGGRASATRADATPARGATKKTAAKKATATKAAAKKTAAKSAATGTAKTAAKRTSTTAPAKRATAKTTPAKAAAKKTTTTAKKSAPAKSAAKKTTRAKR